MGEAWCDVEPVDAGSGLDEQALDVAADDGPGPGEGLVPVHGVELAEVGDDRGPVRVDQAPRDLYAFALFLGDVLGEAVVGIDPVLVRGADAVGG